MATEQCPVCGEHVPFSNTVHVMLNPRDEGGVVDFYVCRECYESDIEPLFADAMAAASKADAEGDSREGSGSGDGDAATADPDEEDVTGDPDDGDTASVDSDAEEATPDASSPPE